MRFFFHFNSPPARRRLCCWAIWIADSRPTVIDLQRLINHLNGTNLLTAALLPYADLNEDGRIDTNDLVLLQNAILGLAPLPNPYAQPVVNAPVAATNGTSIVLTGVVRPNRQVLVTGGRFAVFAVADSNGLFSVTVTLRPNQLNNLFVTASSSNFPAGTPQPLRILQDSQPPNLFIDFPTNGQTLFTSNTVIAGRVGDMLSGFLGLDVWVHSSPSEGVPSAAGARLSPAAAAPNVPVVPNSPTPLESPDALRVGRPALQAAAALPAPGGPASVNVGLGNNGTYERANVPLAPGTNVITVTASDQFGNSTNRQITLYYSPLTNSPRLLAFSGDMQMTNVHRRLAQPIIVRAVQADGVTPFANKLVTLEVTRSDGRLLPAPPSVAADVRRLTNDITATPHGIMSLQLFTDANGEARAWWALGGDAGCGNNRVCASSAGLSNTVFFCASAKPAAVHQINIGMGNNQKTEVGAFVSEPLRAWVSDSCNGIEGLPVTFTVVQGNGRLFRPHPGPLPQGEGGAIGAPGTNGNNAANPPNVAAGFPSPGGEGQG